MIVNEREAMSRAMYWELKRRAPPGVPVYQQTPLQDDVWEALDGDKDDFLVYDRCGLLTFHIVLPFSLLHSPYIEAAIRATHFRNICNCTDDYIMANKNSTTIQLVTDAPERDTASEVAHRPSQHHHHHLHHSHGHHPTNASQQLPDTSHNSTLPPLPPPPPHHHLHIHHHHHYHNDQQQPGNHSHHAGDGSG